MQEIRNTATEMNNAFEVLISKQDTVEENLCTRRFITKSSETEKQRELRLKTKTEQNIQRL